MTIIEQPITIDAPAEATEKSLEVRAAEALERAAEVIDERGWCQFAFSNERGQVCALTAIRIALHGSALIDGETEYRVARDALRSLVGEWVHWWNDDPSNSAEAVQATMRRAAHVLREGLL